MEIKNNILSWIIIILLISILGIVLWFGYSVHVNYQTENLTYVQKEINKSDDILNLSEAAIYINVSEEKLTELVQYSHLKDGKGIPYYKINEKILFSKEALSKWIIYIAEHHFDY